MFAKNNSSPWWPEQWLWETVTPVKCFGIKRSKVHIDIFFFTPSADSHSCTCCGKWQLKIHLHCNTYGKYTWYKSDTKIPELYKTKQHQLPDADNCHYHCFGLWQETCLLFHYFQTLNWWKCIMCGLLYLLTLCRDSAETGTCSINLLTATFLLRVQR